jgi:hypothetical protein
MLSGWYSIRSDLAVTINDPGLKELMAILATNITNIAI